MRLIDLQPRWVNVGFSSAIQGVSFRCPHCGNRLAVLFDPQILPTDDTSHDVTFESTGQLKWKRVGSEFNDLTLEPSIVFAEHWHGFISNGEVINA